MYKSKNDVKVCLCFFQRLIYREGLIPENTWFVGYARSHLSMAELRSRIQPFLKVGSS